MTTHTPQPKSPAEIERIVKQSRHLKFIEEESLQYAEDLLKLKPKLDMEKIAQRHIELLRDKERIENELAVTTKIIFAVGRGYADLAKLELV